MDKNKYPNRVTLAKLLHDDFIQGVSERIQAPENMVREGVLDQTQFVMEAKIVTFVPTIVESNIKKSIQSP